MKNRCLSVLGVCLAASLVLLLAGCPFPKTSVKSASLTVSIKNQINARTLLPPISMDAASYTVEGTGPNGATFSQSTGGDPVTVEGLTFGTWTVTVNALNADGTIIGQGQDVATVSIGQNTALDITVIPLGGTGDLNLAVTWTASLQFPSIRASLVPLSGSSTSLDFAVSGNQASYSGSSIPAGYYTLTLQLLEGSFPVMGAVEVVRIVSGQITSGAYDFSNVNMGTIEVNITPAMANPIPVSISEVPSTVGLGTSVTATASASDSTANVLYVWYLNGVSQATGPSCTLGSNLNTGYYRLDVTAFTADGIRGGSATAEFQVVKITTPIDVTGFWNLSITSGGQTMVAGAIIYFLQTGSSINGNHGITGTVAGSTVTWGVSEGPSGTPMSATGTMQGNDRMSGTLSSGGQTGTWEMTRAVLSFGSLNLDGMVSLHTGKALGWKHVPSLQYRLDFTVPSAWEAVGYGFSFMSHAAAFAAGQVRTVSTNQDDPNGIGAGVDGFGAESGSVSFTSYGGGAADATFNLNFAGGDYLVGSFNLSGGGGTFRVNSGMWRGAPVSGSWSVASWSAYTQDDANDTVSYIDQDLKVRLDVGRHAEEGVGTFTVPDQRNVYFNWELEGGLQISENAVSGTMTIEEYQENVRIKGSFNLQFPSGALSGSFDVPCTTEGDL